MKFSCHLKMYQYLYLIFILICSISANDLNDQDDYSQSINNYDLSSLNTTQNQNVIDLIQTIQLNSTQLDNKNQTGLTTNLTSSNIPILFNQYQYDQSPIYQESPRNKDQLNGVLSSSSSSSQSTFLDSSDTNQNYLTKDYNNFDDSQKLYIEQQIEQDNKYLPEIYNPPSSLPAQIIEPPSNENQISQTNLNDYGTKINTINKPIQNSNRQPAVITKINKYPIKGTVNSIKMANNQEWNVMDKNTQSGYINVGLNNNLDSSKFINTYQSNQDDGFTSFDQQYDLTKINKINKIKSSNQQSNYNRPIDDSTQIITSNNQQTLFQPIQQQIISSNYPTTSIKQQTISHQYNSLPINLPNNYQSTQQYNKKPPCSKNNAINFNRQRPFYFGWKQQQQSQPQRQKVAINNAMNYVQQQQQNYHQNSYQKNNYQTSQNKYFGIPNQFDQQNQLNESVKKCCIVKLVRKPNGFNRPAGAFMTHQTIPFPSSSMMNFNPFQTGMFGGISNGFVNKLENKKSKIKNLIKAPFIFVNDIKHKALGGSSGGGNNYKIRNPNFNYYPMQQQQQQLYSTKTSYSQAYNY